MADPIKLLTEPFREPLLGHWPALLMAAILLLGIFFLRRIVSAVSEERD